MVPSWVADLDEPSRSQFQTRAKLSLQKAIQKSQLIKGKSRSHAGADSGFICMIDGCGFPCGPVEAFLDHIKGVHGTGDRVLAQIRWCIEEKRIEESIRARQERGVMATGFRWPGLLGKPPDQAHQVDAEDGDSNSPSKRRKGLNNVA